MTIPHVTKKIVSIFVIFSFLVSNSTSAYSTSRVVFSPNEIEHQYTPRIEIPPELGAVKENPYSDTGSRSPFIIHIQTIHANYETALQVERIIRYLKDQYRINLIFSEGASTKLHPEFLHFFPDSHLNRKFLETLTQKGQLTGVDLALLDSKMVAVGIESSDFYRAAFQDFKKVISHLNESDAFVDEQKRKLDREASKVFSREYRKLFETWQKYLLNRRDLTAVIGFLQVESKTALELDFENPFSQLEWPQLTRMVLLTELEKRMDKPAFEKEKEKLMGWFRERKIKTDLTQLLDPQEFKTPRLAYEEFLEKAYSRGYRFKNYPQITFQIAYQVLQSELESESLFAELDKLFDRLFKVKVKKKEEYNLFQQYQRLRLIQKLLHLELNQEEWDRIKNEIARRPKRPTRQSLTSEIAFFLPNDMVRTALHFYHLSERREEAFYNNLKREMDLHGQKIAILVTGGFHEEGMSGIFREMGMGYASILPKINEVTDSMLYRQLMLGQAHLDKPEFLEPAVELLRKVDSNYLHSEFKIVQGAFNELAKPLRLLTNDDSPYFRDRKRALRRSSPQDITFPWASIRSEVRMNSAKLQMPIGTNTFDNPLQAKSKYTRIWKLFKENERFLQGLENDLKVVSHKIETAAKIHQSSDFEGRDKGDFTKSVEHLHRLLENYRQIDFTKENNKSAKDWLDQLFALFEDEDISLFVRRGKDSLRSLESLLSAFHIVRMKGWIWEEENGIRIHFNEDKATIHIIQATSSTQLIDELKKLKKVFSENGVKGLGLFAERDEEDDNKILFTAEASLGNGKSSQNKTYVVDWRDKQNFVQQLAIGLTNALSFPFETGMPPELMIPLAEKSVNEEDQQLGNDMQEERNPLNQPTFEISQPFIFNSYGELAHFLESARLIPDGISAVIHDPLREKNRDLQELNDLTHYKGTKGFFDLLADLTLAHQAGYWSLNLPKKAPNPNQPLLSARNFYTGFSVETHRSQNWKTPKLNIAIFFRGLNEIEENLHRTPEEQRYRGEKGLNLLANELKVASRQDVWRQFYDVVLSNGEMVGEVLKWGKSPRLSAEKTDEGIQFLEVDLEKASEDREFQGNQGTEFLKSKLQVGSSTAVWQQFHDIVLSNGRTVKENFEWGKAPMLSAEKMEEGKTILEEDLAKEPQKRQFEGENGPEALRRKLKLSSRRSVWQQFHDFVLSTGETVEKAFGWGKVFTLSVDQTEKGKHYLEEDVMKVLSERQFQGEKGPEALRKIFGGRSTQDVWLQFHDLVLSTGEIVGEALGWGKAPSFAIEKIEEGKRLLEQDLVKEIATRQFQGEEGLESLRKKLKVKSRLTVWQQFHDVALSTNEIVGQAFGWGRKPLLSTSKVEEGKKLLEIDLVKELSAREFQGANGAEALRKRLVVRSMQIVWQQFHDLALSSGQTVEQAFDWGRQPLLQLQKIEEGKKLLERESVKESQEREFQGETGPERLSERLGVGTRQSIWQQFHDTVVTNDKKVKDVFEWPSLRELSQLRSEVRMKGWISGEGRDIKIRINNDKGIEYATMPATEPLELVKGLNNLKTQFFESGLNRPGLFAQRDDENRNIVSFIPESPINSRKAPKNQTIQPYIVTWHPEQGFNKEELAEKLGKALDFSFEVEIFRQLTSPNQSPDRQSASTLIDQENLSPHKISRKRKQQTSDEIEIRRRQIKNKLENEIPPKGAKWTVSSLAEALGMESKTVWKDLRAMNLLSSERLRRKIPTATELKTRRARIKNTLENEMPPQAEKWTVSSLAQALNIDFTTVWKDLKKTGLLNSERLERQAPVAEEITRRRERIKNTLENEIAPGGGKWTLSSLAQALGIDSKIIWKDLKTMNLLNSDRFKRQMPSDGELKERREKIKNLLENGITPKGGKWTVSGLAQTLGIQSRFVRGDLKAMNLLDSERLKREVPTDEEIIERQRQLKDIFEKEIPLGGGRWTVSSLARTLKIKPQMVWYDLKQLHLLEQVSSYSGKQPRSEVRNNQYALHWDLTRIAREQYPLAPLFMDASHELKHYFSIKNPFFFVRFEDQFDDGHQPSYLPKFIRRLGKPIEVKEEGVRYVSSFGFPILVGTVFYWAQEIPRTFVGKNKLPWFIPHPEHEGQWNGFDLIRQTNLFFLLRTPFILVSNLILALLEGVLMIVYVPFWVLNQILKWDERNMTLDLLYDWWHLDSQMKYVEDNEKMHFPKDVALNYFLIGSSGKRIFSLLRNYFSEQFNKKRNIHHILEEANRAIQNQDEKTLQSLAEQMSDRPKLQDRLLDEANKIEYRRRLVESTDPEELLELIDEVGEFQFRLNEQETQKLTSNISNALENKFQRLEQAEPHLNLKQFVDELARLSDKTIDFFQDHVNPKSIEYTSFEKALNDKWERFLMQKFEAISGSLPKESIMEENLKVGDIVVEKGLRPILFLQYRRKTVEILNQKPIVKFWFRVDATSPQMTLDVVNLTNYFEKISESGLVDKTKTSRSETRTLSLEEVDKEIAQMKEKLVVKLQQETITSVKKPAISINKISRLISQLQEEVRTIDERIQWRQSRLEIIKRKLEEIFDPKSHEALVLGLDLSLLKDQISNLEAKRATFVQRLEALRGIDKKLSEGFKRGRNQQFSPRSEVRTKNVGSFTNRKTTVLKISGLDLPFLEESAFIGNNGTILIPVPFLGARGTLGIGGHQWPDPVKRKFSEHLRYLALAGRSWSEISEEIQALENPSQDGVGIHSSVQHEVSETPVVLQVEAKTLNPRDRESLKSRLALLSGGSVVIEYVNVEDKEATSVIASLMREFPYLNYVRKTYAGKLKIKDLKSALIESAKQYKINTENSGFLFFEVGKLEFETQNPKEELKDLGVAFEFNPGRISNRTRVLRGLSGAVFGEVIQYAKLTREVRDRFLAQAKDNGLFSFTNGAFSFLDKWIESRTNRLVSSSA